MKLLMYQDEAPRRIRYNLGSCAMQTAKQLVAKLHK